jgi:serine O-acetyltransferase
LIVEKVEHKGVSGFIYLLSNYRQFRDLFYKRIGWSRYFLNFFCPKLDTLHIVTDKIGEGLFIHIGYATSIGATSIGKNCLICQKVTIGYSSGGYPTIGDNVIVYPGAVILGDITIGNNAVIGANSTVYKDVPENCTVFAYPSRQIVWKPEFLDTDQINNTDLSYPNT